jgi:putative ABC transport system permease protein
VTRWAWRLFRREWRQQLLVLALIVVAVAATIIAAAVSATTPPAAGTGFGTATAAATLQGPAAQVARQIATIKQHVGRVDVIENQAVTVPGSINTYDLRAQNPHGPYGRPMLSLASGHYPTGPGQVAVTAGVAADFHLSVGGTWLQGGTARRVVGIVENPQSLLDEFALVTPGQVTQPTQVTVLFDAPPSGIRALRALRAPIQSVAEAAASNPVNPETISIAGLVVGMLLIALVSVGGFTVLAQRRLRSLGMLGTLGATDRHVRLVVRANGVVVGVVGALIGFAVGFAAWLAYRPILEASAHHVIGMFSLPWNVVALAMALAVVATYFGASRPARAVSKVPIVAALAGRPAPPRQLHRSVIPGVIAMVAAFILFGLSAGSSTSAKGSLPELAAGLIMLIVGVILLAPFCLTMLALLGRRAPISVRLALRDLSRYRARSGSALAAISLGVLIAVIVSIVAAARGANTLDYIGPNLTSNQLMVYTPIGPYGPSGPGAGPGNALSASKLASMTASVHSLATALGSHEVVPLYTTSATLNHAEAGRNWSGPLFVATPQVLHAFGINASQVSPAADILSARPGLSGISKMQLLYGNYFGRPLRTGPNTFPCPANECLASPVIQEVSALPPGTSAPNTVITEHAVSKLRLHPIPSGWFIQAPNALTAAQISNAQATASATGMSVETRNSQPTTATVIDWATAFALVLALGILAMSLGLLRGETASDRRTLAATGASGTTRRNLTAVTAGALGLTGAVLGTVGGYIGTIGYYRSNSFNGGVGALTAVPTTNLVIILIGMPLVAAAAGWLLAGREPAGLGRQPIE